MPPADELLNLFLQMDTLCSGVTDILVVLAVSTGIPFGPVLSHWWGLLEGNSVFIGEVNMLPGICKVRIVSVSRLPMITPPFGLSLLIIPRPIIRPFLLCYIRPVIR